MKLFPKRFILIGILLFFVSSLFSQYSKREFRGAWIATVANIDWPSNRNLTSQQQQEELITMLDAFALCNLNAVIIQIRPTSDAFYFSNIEPWSHWLTGKQGQKPDPYYDPLEFITAEAHKRFMEVHVWLNPYRVTSSGDLSVLHEEHLYYKNKDLFVKYGNRYYFNPGLDETRDYLNQVVRDVVERYDIDAVHFDDYFYPYREKNQEFPDQDTFEKYPRGFETGQKNDWRRNNVNMIIAELQRTIKSIKPWVDFGISPFGVWRNNNVDPRGSATQAGIQNYDDLYADILLWLKQGQIDYVAPQLYWEIGKKVADYEILAKWWSENSYGKNLYIGLYASKLGDKSIKAWCTGNELIRQLNENKKHSEIDGVMYYSASRFLKNPQGLLDSLQQNYYKYPALPPANRNINGEPAAQPQNVHVFKDGDNAMIMWDKIEKTKGEEIAYYVVYAVEGKKQGDWDNPANIVAKTRDNYLVLKSLPQEKEISGNYTFVVTAVNRYRHESAPSSPVTKKL